MQNCCVVSLDDKRTVINTKVKRIAVARNITYLSLELDQIWSLCMLPSWVLALLRQESVLAFAFKAEYHARAHSTFNEPLYSTVDSWFFNFKAILVSCTYCGLSTNCVRHQSRWCYFVHHIFTVWPSLTLTYLFKQNTIGFLQSKWTINVSHFDLCSPQMTFDLQQKLQRPCNLCSSSTHYIWDQSKLPFF